ncbi:MAG: hypothetical protein IKL13_07560 [Clostridia bacterium]|nr:hypothetical protein [Clostridia bacterium]
MKRNNIRIWCLGLCLLCCAVLLAGCPGLSDWAYHLPNAYSIVRANNVDIRLIKENDTGTGGTTVVESHIKAFCYNASFIGLQRVPVDDAGEFNANDYADEDLEYYLIDAFKDEVLGPYTCEEYAIQCQEHNVGDLCEWIGTDTKPSGEEHEKHLY